MQSFRPRSFIVSIDTEKAFDSVDWQYMHKVLEAMGFSPGFRSWVTLLYCAPRMAIRLGIAVSDFFTKGQGTRQGCPLSPFLFASMMEPMAKTLRQSEVVGAIQVGNIKECLALYADDLLLFLRDPGPSLRAALLILDKFASFSAYERIGASHQSYHWALRHGPYWMSHCHCSGSPQLPTSELK